ncbi:MAG: hypothetical protein QM601_04420 [Pseudoxanthomonas sp.]
MSARFDGARAFCLLPMALLLVGLEGCGVRKRKRRLQPPRLDLAAFAPHIVGR